MMIRRSSRSLPRHRPFRGGAVRRQSGIVLPVVMILMVILGVLAVSGMDDTAMQERMAGNLRDREVAFQAAESALHMGEGWIQANRSEVEGNLEISGAEAASWDWGGLPGRPSRSGVRAGLYGEDDRIQLHDDPLFYVGPPQLLRVNPGETPPRFRQIFPVISHAYGATESMIVILRSTFEPL
ncbi:pilus assembly PilX family protein [Chromatocurvus halotolerans]|uniref:Type IV pilus assembly protein PilX n=1 Tax=Chromatocurvus halotolerans TaxID=1132028 RepID=A0A4R2KYB4_9GAMM|nr:PilX N-terminal domain-containing pilus assembly protein [Chromatocurvus halotolerans]TCO76316.1 type IV pilus assembly protein PilX [Chromatocurvus halotolerans]